MKKFKAYLLVFILFSINVCSTITEDISSKTFKPIDPSSPSQLTLVDILSNQKEYTLLLKIIQRLKLVPALNRLNDVSFFAPTDEAILKSQNSILYALSQSNEFDILTDNIQFEARQTLYYHILGSTFSQRNDYNRQLYQTLLHPQSPPKNHNHHSPWLPEPGEGNYLLGDPQLVRISKTNSSQLCYGLEAINIDDDYLDDCNSNHAATVNIDKVLQARNGKIYPIDNVINPPSDLASRIREHPSLTTLKQLIPPQAISALNQNSSKGLTLFLPTNEAFEKLDDTVTNYLKNQFYARPDLLDLLSGHVVEHSKLGVGWSSKWENQDEFETGLNTNVKVDNSNILSLSDSKVKANIKTKDILSSNGVIHLIDSFITPTSLLLLDSEKILVGLNATHFVDLFRSSNLSNTYLKNDEQNSTLLAFRNDVFESQQLVNEFDDDEMSNTLKYHMIPQTVHKHNVTSGQLLQTELRTSMLGGHGQRLVVSKSNKPKSLREGKGGWSFGHASVISDEYVVGNKSIYFISSILEPPKDFMSVAVSDLRLSTFVASVYAAEMNEYLKHMPATTFIIPTNKAFESLGYAMKYLLKSQAKIELNRLLDYHVIDDIVYTQDINQNTSYKTLSPDVGNNEYIDVHKHISKNNTNLIALGAKHNEAGYSLNGEDRKAILLEGDLLTSSGVIHIIDQVERPPSLNLTIRKLLKGAGSNIMLDLFQRAGYQWLLDGFPPPPEDNGNPYDNRNVTIGQPIKPFTVLTPTDAAFTHVNLTYYLEDRIALEALIRMHILPSPPDHLSDDNPYNIDQPSSNNDESESHPLIINDETAYPSLLSYTEGGPSRYGDVEFRKSNNEWTVGIKGARDVNGPEDFAAILGFGKATPHFYNNNTISTLKNEDDDDNYDQNKHSMSIGGGIIVIDSVLLPYEPSWIYRWGWIVAISFGSMMTLLGGGYVSYTAWQRRKLSQAGYESLEGEED